MLIKCFTESGAVTESEAEVSCKLIVSDLTGDTEEIALFNDDLKLCGAGEFCTFALCPRFWAARRASRPADFRPPPPPDLRNCLNTRLLDVKA